MARLLAFLATAALAAAAWANADPPGRVGRLSLLQGEVTFRNTATNEAEPAVLNWPIASGAALETGPGSRAEVRIGSSTIRIDGDSAVEFAVVDDERIQLRLVDGAAAVRVKSREQLADFEILTPQGRVTLHEVGRYRLDYGRAPHTTAVTVHRGFARVQTSEGAFDVAPGRRAEIADGRDFRFVAAVRDEFDDWNVARDRRDDASRSVRYVSPEMTGYEDLDEYGEWREVVEYGPVWVPYAVAADWAPYRSGRWAWIDPWGWTWVDYAPWGFAPFHYGRWVIVAGAWAWVPGRIVARPVYAPALVAWVGRPGWQVSISSGAVPAVGWFPLGPREIFYPGYRCSVNHVRRANVAHVTNVNHIVNVTQVETRNVNYMHRHTPRAVTVAPQNVVAAGRPVAPAAIHIQNRRELAALPVSNAVPDPSMTPPRRVPSERRDHWDRGANRPQAERRMPTVDRNGRESAAVPRAIAPSQPRPEARKTETPRIASPRTDESRRMVVPQHEPPEASAPRALAPQPAPQRSEPPKAPAARAVAPQPAPQRPEPPRVVAPQPAPPPQARQQVRPSAPHSDDRNRAQMRQPEPPRAPPPPRVEAPRHEPQRAVSPPRVQAPQPPPRVQAPQPHRSGEPRQSEPRRHQQSTQRHEGPRPEIRGGVPQQR